MKTSELIGTALKIAVAKADNRQIRKGLGGSIEVRGRTEDGDELPGHWDLWMNWNPATDWSQGGPIIEREKIELIDNCSNPAENWYWAAHIWHTKTIGYGSTALIAAMRCYVASKLGDEMDIPKELL